MKKFLFSILFMLLANANLFAQCAMCTKTAAGLDNNKAGGLNTAIIYLAFIPLIIMGVGGYLYWKYNGKKKLSFK